MNRRHPVAWWALAALLLLAASGWAQEGGSEAESVYRIGEGDRLRLNVPQEPSLDTETTVQAGGAVYIPRVGEVALGGLTLPEAEVLVLQRLRLYDTDVTEIVLTVVEYNALRVFALGAVHAPGSYSFPAAPTLWELLRAAGGPLETANLATCRVITIVDGRPVSRNINLSGYNTGLDFPQDALRNGDTLVVPTVAEGVVSVPTTQGIQVFGGVATPTTVAVDGPTELLLVLMLAGSTLENAELDKVDWVHRAGGSDQATRVDMRDFLEQGSRQGNPLVHPGDVVYVKQRRPSWFQEYFPLFLATLTTISTLVIAYDRLQE